MIVLLEEQESWSLMVLVSAVAIDNAEISFEGKEAIRRWRSDHQEGSPELEALTEMVREEMPLALEMTVPLKVDVKMGNSWGDLE